MQPDLTNYWVNGNGTEFKFDIYFTDSFDDVDDIQQVYNLLINREKDKVMVVKQKVGTHVLPGGSVEEGETLLDTLVREIKEETNRDVDVSTATPIFYQKAFKKNEKGEWEYSRTEARFVVMVSEDNEFEHDPDNGDIVEAIWVDIKDINKYLNWDKVGDMLAERLPEYIERI